MEPNLIPYAIYQDRSSYDPLFPLFIYYDSVSLADGIGLHWHDEFEFLTVLSGEVELQYNSQSIHLHTGDVAFLNSSVLHGYRAYPGSHEVSLVRPLLINPSLFTCNGFDIIQRKYISPLLDGELNPPFILEASDPDAPKIKSMLDEIAGCLKNKDYGHEIKIKSCVFNLLFELLMPVQQNWEENKINSPGGRLDSERFKKVAIYICENYDRKIAVKELADYMNMSEGHFSRFFKKISKKTPIEYINEYKISQAAKMLRETDKKEIEVAMDCGFDNFSYFISIFKNIIHCTPSQYRKNLDLNV